MASNFYKLKKRSTNDSIDEMINKKIILDEEEEVEEIYQNIAVKNDDSASTINNQTSEHDLIKQVTLNL